MKSTCLSLFLKSVTVLCVLSVFSLVFMENTSVEAGFRTVLNGKWDRLNPDQSNPTPEHEVLGCGGMDRVYCLYDKWPVPILGFETPPDETYGIFLGEEVTSWQCPGWFPDEICDSSTFIAGGVMRYHLPDGSTFRMDQNLIVTEIGGKHVLYMYWVDSFVCPWYRSFREALAANPFPLPFDGEHWPEVDCIFAP